MASPGWQRVYRRPEANDLMKGHGTTTSILKDPASRDIMSSSKQAESDEVTKSCADATSKLRAMTLRNDKLPESPRACNIPSSKAISEDITKLETGSSETSGEIFDLRADDELNASSLCEMNTQGMANSASCSQLQQFRGSYQDGPLKVSSLLNTERRSITSRKKAGSELHCEHEHSVIVASGLPSRVVDLHSDPRSSTSSLTNQLSGRLRYGSGRAQTDDTKYVVAGERTSGVRYDVTDSQKKPTRPAVNYYRLPMEKLETEITAVGKSSMAQYEQMQSHNDGLELHCKECNSMGVKYSDLRTIKQIHHTVLDPEFKDRIKTELHKRPNKFDGIKKKEKMYCKSCGGDWGISGLYRGFQIFVLKVSGFTIVDQDHNRYTYSKWKDVPFPVDELRQEDMQSLRQTGHPSSSSRGRYSSSRGRYNFHDNSHIYIHE